MELGSVVPTYRVDQGGLADCCLSSLDEELKDRHERGRDSVDSDTVQCVFCDCPTHNMIRINGVWVWNNPHDEMPTEGGVL